MKKEDFKKLMIAFNLLQKGIMMKEILELVNLLNTFFNFYSK